MVEERFKEVLSKRYGNFKGVSKNLRGKEVSWVLQGNFKVVSRVLHK